MKYLTLITAACLFTTALPAETYNFRQGGEITPGGDLYSGQVQNYLEQNLGNANHGGSNAGRVGFRTSDSNVYRTIIRFEDIQNYISESEVVTDASLTLRNGNPPAQSTDVTIQIYAIKASNAGWLPGTVDGSQEIGASSWNYKAVADPLSNSTDWIGGAGLGAPGDGYELTPIGSVVALASDNNYMTLNGLGTIVQSWIDNPGDNAGLLFRVPNESTESYTVIPGNSNNSLANRPLLQVTTATVPESSTVALIFGCAGTVVFLLMRRCRKA